MMLLVLFVLQATWSAWTHADSPNKNVILNGNWQSCREDDGTYGERIWDYVYQDKWHFEFHMGPNHEFALYRVQQDEEKHDHSDELNELKPHVVETQSNKAKQVWSLPDVRVSVVLAGGSQDRCESWFVTIERKKQ
jgi:hypothetical protein